MAKIPAPPDLGRITEAQDFIRHASTAIKSIVQATNGGLEFDKNINSQTITVTFPKANAEIEVPHTLGRVVQNYLTSKKSVACDISDGDTPATKKSIYLKSTQAATVTLILH